MKRKMKTKNERYAINILNELIFATREIRRDVENGRVSEKLLDEKFVYQRASELMTAMKNLKEEGGK